MSNIDWSKAPEGATHWCDGRWFCVVRNTTYTLNSGGNTWVKFPFGSVIEKAIPRPVAEQQLNIADFRDLRPGDIIWWGGDSYHKAGEYSVRYVLASIVVDDAYINPTTEQWRFVRRPTAEQPNKYSRTVKGVSVDVYDILKAWNVTNPALQHLIKKALQCGERGHKSRVEDLDDILASAKRAKELG